MSVRLFTVTLAAILLLSLPSTTDSDAAVADDVATNKDQRDQAPETGRQGGGRDVMSEWKCARPTAPRQGRVRVRERGKLVYFRCRRRFQLYGSPRAVCINQTWSHPPPVCVATGCSRLARSRGMTIMHPSPQFRDAVLIFTCLPGFTLVGRSTVYCDGRQWSSDPPACVQQQQQPSTSSWPLHSSTASAPVRHSEVLVPFTSSTSEVVRTLSLSSPYFTTEPGVVDRTPVVQHQSNTGVTVTSLDATAASALPSVPHGSTPRAIPAWQLPTLSNITQVVPAVTTFFAQTERPTLPSVVLSSTLGVQRQSETTQRGEGITTDSLVTNSTGESGVLGSSEDQQGGRTLLLYASVAGSCALALVVVAGAACGMAVRRRAPAVRRYQLMDGDDDIPPPAAAAAAASRRSMFYATQYTELTDNDQQRNSAQRESTNNGCSFF